MIKHGPNVDRSGQHFDQTGHNFDRSGQQIDRTTGPNKILTGLVEHVTDCYMSTLGSLYEII